MWTSSPRQKIQGPLDFPLRFQTSEVQPADGTTLEMFEPLWGPETCEKSVGPHMEKSWDHHEWFKLCFKQSEHIDLTPASKFLGDVILRNHFMGSLWMAIELATGSTHDSSPTAKWNVKNDSYRIPLFGEWAIIQLIHGFANKTRENLLNNATWSQIHNRLLEKIWSSVQGPPKRIIFGCLSFYCKWVKALPGEHSPRKKNTC